VSEPDSLILQYSAGKVVKALAGPAIDSELETEVRAAIERDLITPRQRRFSRAVLFSSRPVDGWWRYGTTVQIVPPPANAPRPGMLIGEHPFVLDFEFADTPNFQVRGLRMSRSVYEFELLLDLFLRTGITSPGRSGRHHWILTTDPDQPVRFESEGYFIPGFEFPIAEALPDVSETPPLVAVDAETYYD
jgi:hypothetical protein